MPEERSAEVLDSVSSASDLTKLETIYELTLDALKATANQRPGAPVCKQGVSRDAMGIEGFGLAPL